MNAIKETSVAIQMQLASILKAHTNVNVKRDTRA
jgi:hypothetical protein